MQIHSNDLLQFITCPMTLFIIQELVPAFQELTITRKHLQLSPLPQLVEMLILSNSQTTRSFPAGSNAVPIEKQQKADKTIR